MKLFTLVVLIVAQIGVEPRYQFRDGRTAFEVSRFETENACHRAGNDLTEPLQKGGFRVSYRCEASQ